MADPIQLDAAAALVGKSEVTLRRLIKAGKIPFSKESTATGFIYRVDPEVVRAYYHKEGQTETTTEAAAQNQPGVARIRVAVASDSGDPVEYWQKRAESYEERYHQELKGHAQTREELGVWRGRAEQAQGMIVKLLPSPSSNEVQVQSVEATPPAAAPSRSTESSALVAVLVTIIILICVGAGGGLLYLHYMAR